jgi:hypothetical protein
MSHEHDISPEVRSAIAAFLERCQKEAQPFASAEAIGAIRSIFPDMDISDASLLDALNGEATVAGFEIEYDPSSKSAVLKRKALERWDNEGGAHG